MGRLAGGLAAAFTLLAVGCAHHPALNTYRLMRQDDGQVLVPPNVKGPQLAQRSFTAKVAQGKGACAIQSGPVQYQVRKRKIRVTVDRDALARQKQPGWLSDWTMQAEAQGCVAAGQGRKLGELIVESVPLDSLVAFRLLHASDVQSGYVELGPENKVEVRSPILREAAPADVPVGEITGISGQDASVNVDLKISSSVIGFETAWYGIQTNSRSIGYRFVPLSAERNIQGAVERNLAPAINYFQFPSQAAFFRLLYKTDDNGVTAMVVSGATRPDLDRRTKIVGVDPAACEKESGLCLVLPKRVGVNPFLVVTVNGGDVTVSLSATVRSAIIAAGIRLPENVLPQLTVTRPYAGQPRTVQFDRQTQDIFNLKLAGGETIAWPAPGTR